jgi:hypothetical protein
MADISSGLSNSLVGVGQVSGPVFASAFSKYYGFRATCDVVAIMSLVVGVTYLVIADGFSAFRRSTL